MKRGSDSEVRRLSSEQLSSRQLETLRKLFDAAWPEADNQFSSDDWENSFGGVHFVLESDDTILSHASVVPRELHTEDHRLTTGYVEAVATWPRHQRRGFASAIMRSVGEYIERSFELGALDTGSPVFYEHLGWVVWKGPTFVRTEQGLLRTPEEDGNVLVRLTSKTPDIDLSDPISCEWRPGDVW